MLWRPDGALQLGLEPPAGLLFGRLPPAAGDVLEALRRPCSEQRLRRLAGPGAAGWLPELLGTLRRAGLLDRARPASGQVVLVGAGRLTLLIAQLLLAWSEGPLRVIWTGSPAPPDALAGLRRRHPARVRLDDHLDPDIPADLVIVAARSPEPDRAVARQLGHRPHLAVCGSDLGVSVGPLVVPRRTACLRCEDLHRTDRDPAWPRLLAQLSRPRGHGPGRAEEQWAAGTAVLHAGGWLAGELPDSLGAALELDAGGALRFRPLRPHPGCGCGAAS